MENVYILGIDQGTTSNRACLFSCSFGKIVRMRSKEFTQFFPKDGWVEHDGEEIWQGMLEVVKEVLEEGSTIEGFSTDKVVAVGITNQRETTVVWEKSTGKLIYPAIVWQDRRTADYCIKLGENGVEENIRKKTGLPVDPYFCSSKINWILDNVKHARQQAKRGELLFGTIDTYLIWRLTGGNHVTDVSNASRTNLYNLHTGTWDDELLSLFDVPRSMLGEIKPNNANFGEIEKKHFGLQAPICGVAGDQQASLFGQVCFKKGMIKSTYGTGAFLLVNIGDKPVASTSKMLTTVGYQLSGEKMHYALEGSIFVAGAALKWLHEKLGILDSYSNIDTIAESIADNKNLYLVPAFSGLGAPHWDPFARGAILGITRDTPKEAVVRAALEAMAYQTHDLFEALQLDGVTPIQLKVDGGLTKSNWLLQFMADLLNVDIALPENHETTIVGACFLAALGAGVYANEDEVVNKWNLTKIYSPKKEFPKRQELLLNWKRAVECVQLFAKK